MRQDYRFTVLEVTINQIDIQICVGREPDSRIVFHGFANEGVKKSPLVYTFLARSRVNRCGESNNYIKQPGSLLHEVGLEDSRIAAQSLSFKD